MEHNESEWNIGSMSGKGEVCEELRKRMVDVLFQEVRCGGQGSWMLEMEGKRYKLWWCGKRHSWQCGSYDVAV